jgi:hypothetical protein
MGDQTRKASIEDSKTKIGLYYARQNRRRTPR